MLAGSAGDATFGFLGTWAKFGLPRITLIFESTPKHADYLRSTEVVIDSTERQHNRTEDSQVAVVLLRVGGLGIEKVGEEHKWCEIEQCEVKQSLPS